MPRFVIRNTVSSDYAVCASGVRQEGRYYRFFDDSGDTVFKINAKFVLEVAPHNEYPRPLAASPAEHRLLATLLTGFRPGRAVMGHSWFV